MQFYKQFADKLEIFDPCDQDIYSDPNIKDNQAIKSADLKHKLYQTEKMKAKDLKIVIPNNLNSYKNLMKMFEDQKEKCRNIAK